MKTHAEHSKRVLGPTPPTFCAAWHITFGGKCMNCGYDPQGQSSIYEQLKAAGVPLDSHESDLYAKVTPDSERILAGYEYRENVKRFPSQVDGQMWFEIPFAFTPYWDKKPR